MKLSVRVRYAGPVALEQLARAAEDVGCHGLWVSEPWGLDAGPALGWCAARTSRLLLGTHVASVYARTPAATGGLAASLQSLSGGRFRLGLGASGPDVVEGWHGVPFSRPVSTTADAVTVVRQVLRGDPLEFRGATTAIPLGQQRRALRSSWTEKLPEVPVYLGAVGPRNQQLAAEVADGWTPTPYSPDCHEAMARPFLDRRAESGRAVAFAPVCPVALGNDLPGLLRLEKAWSALYLAGMGTFYGDAVARSGRGAMVDAVRSSWLARDRAGAKAAVDDDYADSIGLFGPAERVRDRASRYRDVGVDELVLELRKPDLDDQIADLRSVCAALS